MLQKSTFAKCDKKKYSKKIRSIKFILKKKQFDEKVRNLILLRQSQYRQRNVYVYCGI